MPLTKVQKQKILDDLKDRLFRQKAIILVGISGLKVKDLSDLRKKIKAADGSLQVAKKTLAEIAFREKKLDFDKDKFKTELGFVFGFKDEISPAKTVYQFSKENENLKILGGYLEGKFKTAEEIVSLAQLPTREELLIKLISSINSSITGLINVLQGNIKGLISVLAKAKAKT
jgi:large subunit ribosomal protein L10